MISILTTITIILSSSVLAALFTSLTNLYIKRKELYVQVKLEEQNRWIININNAQKEYINALTIYNLYLIRYSMNKVSTFDISNRLIETNMASNNLMFYVNQTEFNTELIEGIENINNKIFSTSNKQRKASTDYINNVISKSELAKITEDCEKDIGKECYRLSEELGILVRCEKIELVNGVKSKVVSIIKNILMRTTNGQ